MHIAPTAAALPRSKDRGFMRGGSSRPVGSEHQASVSCCYDEAGQFPGWPLDDVQFTTMESFMCACAVISISPAPGIMIVSLPGVQDASGSSTSEKS
jgi:hypothetical protein